MTPTYTVVGILCLGLAYLVGAISPGYLVVRWLKGADIRELGSGSTGATNVLRIVGKGPALGVFLFDVGKGFLAFELTEFWLAPTGYGPWWAVAAGLAAVIGHSNSIWLGGKGGKSVATSLGLLWAMDGRVALATFALWGVAVLITRFVSVGSVLGGLAVTGFAFYFEQPLAYLLLCGVGGAFVVWRHRSNIERLLAGTEPKLGTNK